MPLGSRRAAPSLRRADPRACRRSRGSRWGRPRACGTLGGPAVGDSGPLHGPDRRAPKQANNSSQTRFYRPSHGTITHGYPHLPPVGWRWRLQATKGAAEWEGPGLLLASGSSINDIATALSIFCSQYSAKQWGDLLREELPELTDEDIEWLCGLTELEAMESHEPIIVHKDPGRFSQPLTRTITGKRRRRSKGEGTATSSQNSRGALPLSESAPGGPGECNSHRPETNCT